MNTIKNCSKCGSNNFWSIDNKTEYVEICSDCKSHKAYSKQTLLLIFKCEKCGSNSGRLNDNDDIITIVCSDCQHENIVLIKQNVSVDNRNKAGIVVDKKTVQEKHIPKCPICSSPNIHKISMSKRAVHGAMFGLFSKTARSQWECKNCGNKW